MRDSPALGLDPDPEPATIVRASCVVHAAAVPLPSPARKARHDQAVHGGHPVIDRLTPPVMSSPLRAIRSPAYVGLEH